MQKYESINYYDYLKLDQFLKCHERQSVKMEDPAHDEHLFINIHQAYELWFQQVLFELSSIRELFSSSPMPENSLYTIAHRLERIEKIQTLLLQQIDVLETMEPMDFLDFRDYLYPASGFQSSQFREIEIMFGLTKEQRVQFDKNPFYHHLPKNEQQRIIGLMTEPSLFQLLEGWLERTPYIEDSDFHFWNSFTEKVEELFVHERSMVEKNHHLSEEMREKSLLRVTQLEEQYRTLINEKEYVKAKEKGFWRFSYKALQALMFIMIYRDEPALQMPNRIINSLQNIDENWTIWRYRHAKMALRMLGRKFGTGGSSGHDYLKSAAESHSVYGDLVNLSTFLIKSRNRPHIPSNIRIKMSPQTMKGASS